MSNHPVNLAVRFALEIAALLALGAWGWQAASGILGYLLALLVPVLAAAIWGIFRVPGDPGPAPVATPGPIRLSIELAFFALATLALAATGRGTLSMLLGVICLLHYVVSYDRVAWLVRNKPPSA